MKKNTLYYLVVFSLALNLLTSCAGQLGVTQPQATSVPLAQRELADVVMQKGDLPQDYDTYSVESLEGVFPNVAAAHEGVVNSQIVLLKTADSKHVYTNGIILYSNEDQAIKAFAGIKEGTNQANDFYQFPDLGDEHYTLNDVISSPALGTTKIYLSLAMWRMKDAVLYVSVADSLEQPSEEQIITVVEKVHERATK